MNAPVALYYLNEDDYHREEDMRQRNEVREGLMTLLAMPTGQALDDFIAWAAENETVDLIAKVHEAAHRFGEKSVLEVLDVVAHIWIDHLLDNEGWDQLRRYYRI